MRRRRDHGDNGYGEYRTTIRQAMADFDAAPPLLRHAMRYAVAQWAAKPLTDHWRAGVPERVLIAAMCRGDRADTAKTYGPMHPEAAHE